MTSQRYATVHYRRLVRSASVFASGKTLSQTVQDALNRSHASGSSYLNDWRARVAPSPSNNPQLRLTNDLHLDSMSTFGILCAYTPGDMQALIKANTPVSASAPISELKAPTNNEYVNGIAYWLIIGDHVYIVQHSAVRTKALEEYLTWLLRDETQMINPPDTIILQSAFDISSVGGDLENVKAVEIGGITPETVQDGDARETEERKSIFQNRPLLSSAPKLLSAIFGDLRAKEIINSVPPEASLDVLLSVGYRIKRRRELDTSFMSKLATDFRNLDDGEVKIFSKDGTVRGDEARLHENMPFKIMRPDGILFDLNDVRTKMGRVHQRFVEDGKIDSDGIVS